MISQRHWVLGRSASSSEEAHRNWVFGVDGSCESINLDAKRSLSDAFERSCAQTRRMEGHSSRTVIGDSSKVEQTQGSAVIKHIVKTSLRCQGLHMMARTFNEYRC